MSLTLLETFVQVKLPSESVLVKPLALRKMNRGFPAAWARTVAQLIAKDVFRKNDTTGRPFQRK